MKTFTKMLLLLSLIACASAPSMIDERPTSAKKTWHILSPEGGTGSAFPVQSVEIQDGLWQTLFLTAAHMAQGQDVGWQAQMNQNTGTLIKGGVLLSKHPERDAALVLFISEDSIPVMPLTRGLPSIGDDLWVVGYPKGGPFVISNGQYSGPFREYFTMSAPLFSGNSGGPVLDSDGAAVGIAVALEQVYTSTRLGDTVMLPIYHVSYFTPIASITTWLEGFGIL